jgi:hypothetical protein
VERLTLEVLPSGASSGMIQIAWDRSEFVVPFTVR